ncbi:MAG TPA: autotransporter-associated beta strand repeat-containing protein [Verrucomicrobiae bacterium]|nr:autotransporter-associated beta strand repeat-containing protein [Verrucomicrobiae bacterium]
MSRLILQVSITSAAICFATSAWAQDGFCLVNGTTTGGAGGPTITVTNGSDFVTQVGMTGPRIIQVSGMLSIGSATVRSDKTIVGVSPDAALLGRLSISGVSNVIVQNLRITSPGNDGISIRDPNTHHVWVDHVTFYDCGDGSCDISQNADYVTVSWCKFMYPTQLEHRFAMIADGQSGNPESGRITLHHNWWSTRADQRMGASSYARVHYYNNFFNCTNNSYCSNARNGTEINSENNYYAGVKDAMTVSSGTDGKIRTSGNTYASCTGTIHPGTDSVFTPPYPYTLDATANVPNLVTNSAGAPGPNIVLFPPKLWDGGGANNNLRTANNWGYAGGYSEAPKEYDTLLFAGSTRLTVNNDFTAGTDFPALNFSNNASAFTLSGNAIGLGRGITNDSSTVQTINLNLDFAYAADHFSTNRYFNVTSPGGSLVINSQVAGQTNAYGRIYSVTKLGPGLLTLAGVNTFAANLNLNGGLVRFSTLDTALPGSLGILNRLNFDGGGLQWADGNTADITVRPVTIQTGGARLDVGANDVIFANAFGNNGPGGLTKTGTGTLTLNGNNNYNGSTLIEQGVLALGAAGALPNTTRIILSNNAVLDVSARNDGTLVVGNGKSLVGNGTIRGSVIATGGSTIAPGFSIGTLVITNSLAFQATSTNVMEISTTAHTNDLLTGMITVSYGGRLVVTNLSGTPAAGDSFKLFNAANYSGAFSSVVLPPLASPLYWTNNLAVDGTITVVSPVNVTPTSIAFAVTGNSLQLSWPPDRTGWRLEIQTNHPATGLSTNWFTVPGSSGTNEIYLPIDTANASVFLRLAYP